jgi:hypothetical protein
VLGFLGASLAALAVLLVVAPGVYDAALALPPERRAWGRLALLVAVAVVVGLLVVGVRRRWRWTFWLVLVAFGLSGVRVPVTALQLGGVLPLDAPTWYAVMQALIGAVQFVIARIMFTGYRRAGPWG